MVPLTAAPAPEAVLVSLQSQLLRLAKQIGKLRHCLSDLDHASSREALRAAVLRAVALLSAVISEYEAPSAARIEPHTCSATEHVLGGTHGVAGGMAGGGVVGGAGVAEAGPTGVVPPAIL